MSANTPDPRIALFGANGLLGRAIFSSFSRRACSPRTRLITFDRANCDITDNARIDAIFSEHRPTIAINCAAYTKVDQAEQEPALAHAINVTATANLARACKTFNTKLVHISTDFVFDGTATIPYQPDSPTHPLSVYGSTKRDGEREIESIDPPGWLILRTSWLFGSTGPCFPRMILQRATAGQTLTIVNDQIGSPTYALDLADAIFDLIEAEQSGIHHVTNAGQCSWFDFASAVVEEFDLPTDRVRPITTEQFLQMRPIQAKRPMYSVMADDSLPITLRPWRETLPAFRSTGILPVSL